MAHLNLYIPDDLAARLKREASAAGMPLSRFMLSQIRGGASLEAWPTGFFAEACGFLTEDMEEPADSPPEPVDQLDLP